MDKISSWYHIKWWLQNQWEFDAKFDKKYVKQNVPHSRDLKKKKQKKVLAQKLRVKNKLN